LFANYMIANKVDVLAGYMLVKDDWQVVQGVANGYYRSNGYFGEFDYCPTPLTSLSGRYDDLDQRVTGGPGGHTMHQLNAAVNRSLVRSGAVTGRLGYSYLTGRDPIAAVKSTSRLLQAVISFNF
jgi:hypothetical protein